MSHHRTDSASSGASTDRDAAEVNDMLTRSLSTLSSGSIRTVASTEAAHATEPPSPTGMREEDPLSRDGSTESIRSVISINDIIQPEQNKTIHALLDDIHAHSTDTLLHLARKGLTWLSERSPQDRLMPAPRRVKDENRIDAHRFLTAMLDCVEGDKAKRYVAAAIVTCGYDIDQYIRLVNTWFGFFLWPCTSFASPLRHRRSCGRCSQRKQSMDGWTPHFRSRDTDPRNYGRSHGC